MKRIRRIRGEQIPPEIREANDGIRRILDGSWQREQLANLRRFEEASEKVEIFVGPSQLEPKQ